MNTLAIAQFLQEFYVIPLLMAVFVIVVSIRFFINYIKPARLLCEQIYAAISNLSKVKSNQRFDKNLLDEVFETNETLSHAWLNYKSSLHDLNQEVDGESVVVASKSTVSSEVFFLSQ